MQKGIPMKRLLALLFGLVAVAGLAAASALAAAPPKQKPAFVYEDKLGVVKIKPGEPIHIAYWFVVAGPDA